MSKWRKSLFGNRGLGVNLIASFCFILLAVYGWGLTWQEVGEYLVFIIGLLAALLIPAFLLGLLLRKIRK